jgi:hypothetical protein
MPTYYELNKNKRLEYQKTYNSINAYKIEQYQKKYWITQHKNNKNKMNLNFLLNINQHNKETKEIIVYFS